MVECGSTRPGFVFVTNASDHTKATSNIMDSSPGPVNDEVIADSEGEMDEEDHPGDRGTLIKS